MLKSASPSCTSGRVVRPITTPSADALANDEGPDIGAVLVDDLEALPPAQRFFTGGDTTVRGYAYESLGPVDESGEVVGGRVLVNGSLEYEHPIGGAWSAAAFVDAGNAFAFGEYREKLELGVGGGVRWHSPFLLTGRSSSSASRNELALLSQAALGLGLESAGVSSMQLQSTLGLDEVSVDAAGDDGDASLVLGKRLTPDISVKYALGLFGRVGTVLLNYRLTDHISLEAESGAGQGLDLLFSLERESLAPWVCPVPTTRAGQYPLLHDAARRSDSRGWQWRGVRIRAS